MLAENSAALAVPLGASPEQSEREEKKPVSGAPEQRDLFARAQRRKLPDERKSITHKFSIGGHEGYIIVGMYDEGEPGEVFIKMAKEGSALSISIGLQYGVPLKALVDKLTNTRFEPSGFTENPNIRYSSSVLDYIARWLGGKFLSAEYLKPRAASSEDMIHPAISSPAVNAGNHKPIQSSSGGGTAGDAPSCSTCGMLMVPTEAATSASTAGAQADVHKNRTRGRRGAVVPDETGPHTERVSESPWPDSSMCANTSRNPQFSAHIIPKQDASQLRFAGWRLALALCVAAIPTVAIGRAL